jgi:hypothetical protein
MLPGSCASYSYTANSESTDMADSVATSPPGRRPRQQVSDFALPRMQVGAPPRL